MTHQAAQTLQRVRLAKMYRHAQQIKTQSQLDLILLEMPNPRHRGVFFELIKPMLRFEATYSAKVSNYDPNYRPTTP